MKKNKQHKKEFFPKKKDQIEDKIYHKKSKSEKIKYRHKTHWLDEAEWDEIDARIKIKEEE